jgi:large subunit ribosomal protein L18
MSKNLTKHANRRDRARLRRRRSIRKRVVGSAQRPRLAVFRSNRHMYAQVIDDRSGHTLAAVSTLSPEVRSKTGEIDKKSSAELVGAAIAKACLKQKIDTIVFDRGGFLFQGGRMKALAEAARKAGLKF